MCASQRDGDGENPIDAALWLERMETMATAGQRVLAVAWTPAEPHRSELDFSDVDSDLTLLGLLGLMDPPRQEAIAAVRTCRKAGIRVKMITGDHAATARAMARRVGLANSDEALTGAELDAMDDHALQERVGSVDIYARVTPEHKLRLVLFNARYMSAPVLNREGLLGNRFVLYAVGVLILFQLAFTYLPPVQRLFATASIDAGVWLRIVLVAASVLFIVELEKALMRRQRR